MIRKRFVILAALLMMASSHLCYGSGNDDFAKSLSNYENRVEEIYQQLDYAYWNTKIEKNALALILKVKNSLHKLESDMNEEEGRLSGKWREKRPNSGESSDLTDKLKTLNKLLADRVITKDDFEQQKKQLLDNYTEKTN